MGKAYFSPDVFVFLRALKRNNRRDWFLKNKERYEETVRRPCLHFITDLRLRMREISPWLLADPKPNGGSLFRIYRDVRFSSDKSPYKTHVGMNFRHAGSKETAHGAGFYLHFEPGQCFLAGGCWQPEPRTLARIRDAVAWQSDAWKAATRKLNLGGDTLKRPPKGYPADHPMIEDLKRKDFIASLEFTDKQVCSDHFMEDFMRGARTLSPLLKFLCEAERLRF